MDERRYFGLDALRGGMMMLGIVLHAAVFYLAAPPPHLHLPTDRNTSYVFDLLFHFIHSFRMPTFFLLAGFFASLLVEKRGLWGTCKNRVARILAPLVAGALTVLPLALLFTANFMVAVRFGTHEWLPARAQVQQLGEELLKAGVPADEPSLGHLWFLYYLCYFYFLIPLCRFLVEQSRRFERPLVKMLLSPASVLVFSLYTALSLWPFHGGQVHEGFIFLKPHLPSLVYYGSFFVFGYAFHFYRIFLPSLAAHVRWSAGMASVLFPLSLYLSYLDNAAAPAPSAALHLATVLAHALCTWSLVYLFIGSALRFFDRESPWTLYISQSSYWVFLLHLPFSCLAAWWLVPYQLPAIVKFLVVVTFTTLVCFLTYHYCVQKTWISVFLNGRRFNLDWPWRKSAEISP